METFVLLMVVSLHVHVYTKTRYVAYLPVFKTLDSNHKLEVLS